MKLFSTLCMVTCCIGLHAETAMPDQAKDWLDTFLKHAQTKSFKSIAETLKTNPIPEALNQTIGTAAEAQELSEAAWTFYKEYHQNNKLKVLPDVVEFNPENVKGYVLSSGNEEMPFVLFKRGECPKGGWPMFIATHGGGCDPTAPHKHASRFNNSEWSAQIRLASSVYPNNAIYFVPRMPNDKHGRWWYGYSQDIYMNLIRQAILFCNVNPNKIYFIGISEGGYATYRLAPFFADKWGACGAMAAGDLPATCPAENLKVTPFTTSVGEFDQGFQRCNYAKTYHDYLNKLAAKQANSYVNKIDVQKGRGHGIDYSVAPQWAYQHTRNPHPLSFHWINYELDKQYRSDFFWLEAQPVEGCTISYETRIDQATNSIYLTINKVTRQEQNAVYQPHTGGKVKIHLNDQLVQLDKGINVYVNGKQILSNHKVNRTMQAILRSIALKGDPTQIYTANLEIAY